MPAITFTSKGPEALSLFNYSMRLKGDSAQFAARAELRDAILKVWPELDGDKPQVRHEEANFTRDEKEAARLKRLTNDTRDIQITATQQTALAEGFLKFVKDLDVSDADKAAVMGLAKKVRCRGFLDRQIAKTEIREFAESDEEIELDPEPASEPGPQAA